jgi:hypothetical protein
MGLDGLHKGRPFVQSHLVTRHPKGGIVGCFDSHQGIARKALLENKEWLFAAEDDARPFAKKNNTTALIKELGRFVRSRSTPEYAETPVIVQLGYAGLPLPFVNGDGSSVPGFDSIIPVRATFLSHAYLANAAAMRVIVAMDPTCDVDYDRAVHLRKQMPPTFEQYVVKEQLWFQCDCGTSVTGLSRFVQATTGMRGLQEMGTFATTHPYAYSSGLFVTLLLFAGLILAAALLWTPRAGVGKQTAAGACCTVGAIGVLLLLLGVVIVPLALGVLWV